MAIRYGAAESPEIYALRLTVEAPTGTSPTTPVEVGAIFKLAGTDADGGGHKIAALVDNDNPATCVMVRAEERAIGVNPMSVVVLSQYHKVLRIGYLTGAAPSIGQSIQASATVGKVDGLAYANGAGYVLYVNTATEEVEVLL